MKSALEIFCNGVLTALLNGVYQGLFVTLLAGIYLKLNRRLNAATRHGALLATLAVVTALPLLHFSTGTRPSSIPGSELSQIVSPAVTEENASFPAPEEIDVEVPENLPVSIPTVEPKTPYFGTLAGALRSVLSSLALRPFELPAWTSLGLVGCWVAVSALLLIRLGCQLCFLRSWKRAGKPAPETFQKLFQELNVELDVKRSAQLLISDQTALPIAAGFQHPAVLLPGSLVESIDLAGARQVLRHEVAHLARHDDWANLLQQIAKAILFFHPGVWVLDRQLTLQREIACDDQVLAVSSDRRSYALFLTEFASRPHRRQLAAVTAAWSNKGQLKERINMILNSHRNASPRLARARVGVLTLGAAVIGLLALRAGPRVLFAQESATSAVASTEGEKQIASSSAAEITSANVNSNLDVRPEVRVRPRMRIARVDGTIASVEGGPKAKGGEAIADDQPSARAVSRKDREDDGSLERRIERLEKMVKTLLAREKAKGSDEAAARQSGREKSAAGDIKPGRNIEKEMKYSKLNDGDVARILEQAKAEAERGHREAERAIKDAQRAIAESTLTARVDGVEGLNRHILEAEHHALETQHAALERQMHAIEKQLSRLEKDKEKLDKEKPDKDGNRKKRDDSGERDSRKGDGSGDANNKSTN